jgi:RIO kinase 2
MESTKGSQSHSEGEDVGEEDEEGEGGEEMGGSGSEREKSEGGEVEDSVASEEEMGREDEESDGSAKLQRGQEQTNARAKAESPSRERPRSGSSSPTSQITSQPLSKEKEIRKKAAIDAFKGRAREKQKYHSRRGAERIGRPKGSKAKQDNRVKVDKSGLWD